jgi:2-C-methyl-D-erythritol 2,4-cyclodiphosphate synthase
VTALRVGQGFDAHRLVAGRPLVLGGVQVPFERGLEGHSDGDCLLHAVCDALLGAAAAGDMGRHFPSRDPRWKGRSSLALLDEASRLVQEKGYVVENVDATVIAQVPRLSPYLESMQETLARHLGLDKDFVSIKAKSPDGLGAIGRAEGIAAQAVVLLSRKEPS